MKKTLYLLLISLVMAFSMPFWMVGQGNTNVTTNAVTLTVNGSALLAIATGNVSLSLSGAAEAGAAIQTVARDSTTRLKISSLVDGSSKRTITAALSAQPVGTELLVSVQAPNGSFYAPENQGTLLSDVNLTTSAQNIITGIGTCWSGTAIGDGYVIKYTYQLIAGAINLASSNVTVTYTLTAAI
jgi:hypothetical protein